MRKRMSSRVMLSVVCVTLVVITLLAVTVATKTTSVLAASRGNQTPDPLTQLAYHSYQLTITSNNQTISGQLDIGGRSVEYPTLLANFTAPAEEFKTFFNFDAATYTYYLTHFSSNGQLTSPVAISAGKDTIGKRPNSVYLTFGAPEPGSLNEGGGILSIEGLLHNDNTIVGTPGQPDSSFQERWLALPVLFFDDFEHGASRWSPQLGTWKICHPSDNPSHAYCASGQGENLSIAGNATWNNYRVQSVVENASSDFNQLIAVLGRVQDSSHYYELELSTSENGPEWVIVVHNGLNVNYIASGPYSWLANTQYVLQLTMHGNKLTAAISTDKGKTFSVLGSATDSTYTKGKIGLRNTGSGSFDNVLVTQD